ncbi:ABC transporter permease [Romboutsia weinsteinii]|uniref:ABC transporter permease n=1 Tax=Romboutsia weinsteinii TaxID=2020949 RepID=A0A371J9M0_9FIRM|nr:ABC transporter permease [Romboutsia weinsteinii]RDY29403.1 ABC transporter permease [Romboutsia weinsteinii]
MSSNRGRKKRKNKKYVSQISNKLFKELAKNNVKKSIKDYTIYFITLAFGVALLYSFNALDDNLALLNGNIMLDSYIYMARGLLAGFSIVICLIFGYLITYSNNFLMKKRKKEFGVYTTLGMDKRDINKLMFKETVNIGSISLVVGLLMGIFLSQGLSMIAFKMLSIVSLSFKFSLSIIATIKTIVFYVLVLLIVNKFNKNNIQKNSLIDLLNSDKKNESFVTPGKASKLILFAISILFTIVSYIIFFKSSPRTGLGYLMVFASGIALLISGTYLFFLSVSDFIIINLKKSKRIYYNNLNLFIINQISSRIKTTSSSITAICVLLLIAMIIMPFGMTMGKYLILDLKETTPYDASITRFDTTPNEFSETYSDKKKSSDKYTTIKKELLENNISLDKLASSTSEVKKYSLKNVTLADFITNKNLLDESKYEYINIIGINDYNSVRKQRGLDEIKLNSNEFIINYDVKTFKPIYESYVKSNPKPIEVNGTMLKLKYSSLYNLTYSTNISAVDNGTIIVPDRVLSDLNPVTTTLNVNYIESNNTYDNMFLNALFKFRESSANGQYNLSQKLVIDGEKVALNTTLSFISVYVGVILLISAGAVLALQQLSESAVNKERFKLLDKLGVKESDRKKTIFMQVFVTFITPLALAILHSAFVTRLIYVMIPEFSEVGILKNMITSIVIVVIIYGIYLSTSYFESLNIINEKKTI